MRTELDDPPRLRLGDPVGAAARRRDAAGARRPGRAHRCARRSTSSRKACRTSRDFTVRAGERVPFVLTWFPSNERLPDAGRSRKLRFATPRRYWREWMGGCAYHGDYREAVHTLAADAEGADVRADRRDRRRADDVAARADRRRSQLGLPLLLAARRDVHALRADERRLHRRGARVAQLAAARGRRRPGEGADPLRRRRAAAHPRVRARLAARLRGLAAGAHRQRGARAVPARRLRRGDGRPAPGARARARPPTTTHGRCSAT